jgi:hypothetical protein
MLNVGKIKRAPGVCRACVTISTLVGLISDVGACQARFLNPLYYYFEIHEIKNVEKKL